MKTKTVPNTPRGRMLIKSFDRSMVDDFKDIRVEYVVAIDEEVVIGVAVATHYDRDANYVVRRIGVRGNGSDVRIYRKLIGACERKAHKLLCERVYIEVDDGSYIPGEYWVADGKATISKDLQY